MPNYSKEDVLNEEERKLLLGACKNEKERLVITTLMYTGMRASEFAHMKSSWVDWQTDQVIVPRQDEDGWTPKSKRGARKIPLNRNVRATLSEWFRSHQKIKMHRSTVFNIVKRVAKRISDRPFKKVYPHSLRATFATLLAQSGLSAPAIQDIMGWEKLETANNYVKSVRSREEFIEKMQGVE